ncbi:CapA family protein [Thalassobacillus sp. CUG 92003]|uniref:CapA family protein n=1 Tax=Thalassobacillus sp. CUG 92003 TaxID=2736641 RepID=UPI0015E7C5F9|nr:CapA family protein [Thalassobacillus sp. CUG 92003]
MPRKLTFKEKIVKKIKANKRSSDKYAVVTLVILLLFIFGFNQFYSPDVPKVDTQDDSEFTASFVGDMMFGRFTKEVPEAYGEDYLLEHVRPYFEASDYVTGNFENPVLTQDKENYEPIEKAIQLKTDRAKVKELVESNFTNVSLANNHTMDYGPQGMMDTLEVFNDEGLEYVGAGENAEEANQIKLSEHNGITVATLGYSDVYVEGFEAFEFRPGIALADPEVFLQKVSEAKQQADLVIVHMHWGAEYDNEPHPRQEKIGHAIADAGADILVGHHPHVLSPVEVYNDSVIFYSLGNFIFDQGWSRTRDSALVKYDLLEDGTGRFEITPTRIREAQPTPTNNIYNRYKIFKQLTRGQPQEYFNKEDGKLIVEVDHSDVLEKGE